MSISNLNQKLKTTLDSTTDVDTKDIAQSIESMRIMAANRRRAFERKWYDNNFFDDGHHFRYLSRTTNKIVDLSERATIYSPQRSIPKASRQIRGVANLLMASDPTPAVYPDPIDKQGSASEEAYKEEQDKQKDIARKRGLWLQELWKKDDLSGESIMDKISFMILLSMKHGVSFLQVWPDEQDE